MSNAQGVMHRPPAGVDVSNWNGRFDWASRPGLDFGAAKACEGTGFVDPDFAWNWDQMRMVYNNKLVRIAYAFAHPGEAVAPQADLLVQLARDHGLQPGDHFEMDLEVMDGCSVPEVVRFARAFSERVNKQALDHRCVSYTFEDFPAPWGLWPLHIAAPGVLAPVVPHPWTRYWFWQNNQTGVDTDVFNGSKEELLNFCRMPADRR